MEPTDHGKAVDSTADRKEKKGRTPLKQPVMSRPITPPATALRQRRKRIGGKRTVRSCTSCRAAHVRCVADRYGVPCERCAKKSWLDVSCSYQDRSRTLCVKIQRRRLIGGYSAVSCISNRTKLPPRLNLPTKPGPWIPARRKLMS
ncbi:hypothetical protein F5B21DRAFT_497572 [Xylaria acuta]|nr:hypothetical protein F5B21DRAFT_497572 [Xylaria acuta]